MNTANLQLEGLVMAIASITKALVANGSLTTEEVDKALATAEQTALGDDRVAEDLSSANRDAILFPLRVLRAANNSAGDETLGFAELARMVGTTKQPHNDQR